MARWVDLCDALPPAHPPALGRKTNPQRATPTSGPGPALQAQPLLLFPARWPLPTSSQAPRRLSHGVSSEWTLLRPTCKSLLTHQPSGQVRLLQGSLSRPPHSLRRLLLAPKCSSVARIMGVGNIAPCGGAWVSHQS